ncbi:NAD(P)-dependent oxidoreductase [Thermoanaerobacteraceae bacterium SP2]|nr:NAD(P)-dependent oxidoreductase [Thermoanaerobacteraceae bacterium SP2]
MKIGMIGLGAMGLPISERLLSANYELYVYDIVSQAVEKAVSKGAVSCHSAGEVASNVDVVMFSLPNARIIQDVLEEILACNTVSANVIADLSSVSPASSRHFAEMMGKKKIKYIDCPVSGGVGGAAAGTLTVMVGGDKETLDMLMPVLNTIGKKIYHVGEVGAGSAIKMINNYILGCNMATVAEALVLGAKLGLDLATMHEIIQNSTGRSFIIENKVPNFIMKRNFGGGFAVDLEYKDLGLSIESAKQMNMPLLMGSTAVQVFEMARAKGFGKQDITSLVKIWEELMNIEVK